MKRLLIILCAASTLLGAGAAVALAAASTSGGAIHIYGVNTNGANKNDIIITGAFAARGTTRNLSANIGQVITPKGTFKVNLAKLNAAPGRGGLNPKSCSGAFSTSGPVTLFGGTGAYKGIKGTVRINTTFAAIVPRLANGKCNGNATTTAISYFQGSGTVSF